MAAITRADNPGAVSDMFSMSWQGESAAEATFGGASMIFDVTSGAVSDMYWGKGLPQGVNGELCSL